MTTTDPPRCAAHPNDPTAPRPGAPPGNTNALKHGAYRSSLPNLADGARPSDATVAYPAGLASIIAGLTQRVDDLGAYIDAHDLSASDYLSALNLLSLLATRLARVQRDQQALAGADRSDLDAAISDALDVVSESLGAPL